MFGSAYQNIKYFITSKAKLNQKIFEIEWILSEFVYKVWCRLTGGRFVRNYEKQEGCCYLITLRGFHLISTIFSQTSTINPSQLEVYKRNCPAIMKEFPLGRSARKYFFRYWWADNSESKCEECGRSCEIFPSDEKIMGKFPR